MARASIPVDLFNPGQVFACLGFMEAAEILCGGAEAGFDWSDPADARFCLRADGEKNPFAVVLEFLAACEVKALAPAGSELSCSKWKIPTDVTLNGDPFPFPQPPSPATLPAVLHVDNHASIPIVHWGDSRSTTHLDTVKFWAGAGGYPGVALAHDALKLAAPHLPAFRDNPFALSAGQSSSFRFDWRRDYIALGIGFSVDAQSSMTIAGYPLVEILAAIGLTHARPERITKLDYRYAAIASLPGNNALHPPIFLRAALGAAPLPFPRRSFRMVLNWPGQEDQARCITNVYEETTHD